jgi:small-conductance mechanosensitive channel
MFTGSMLGFVSIVVVSYMFWQFFITWIDRRIRQEMPQDSEEADEGGKGGSRIGTLLILLRKFVFILLIILAIFFTLSTFGVNIGPLIAGAGIIGLAISFGAQSLVTDIFAGIFFLVDDAFRVGDYIDIGTAKGSVEQISLRSVRLRHHRGMVQTIPFGKIDTVTNYSRDYIITKFDLRIRYDTDIEKVRKLIKRIYIDLSQDETFGPKLIGKLKSQGIRQMDDSAMLVRIKFTTPPGEQFILRKEIYRRIQESFAANNIEFAHRNVTVYMPKESEVLDNSTENVIAGAAALENQNKNQERVSDDR